MTDTPDGRSADGEAEPAAADTTPSPELRRDFWVAAVAANVSLLAASLAAMFLVFRGQVETAVVLAAVALAAGLLTYRAYRRRAT